MGSHVFLWRCSWGLSGYPAIRLKPYEVPNWKDQTLNHMYILVIICHNIYIIITYYNYNQLQIESNIYIYIYSHVSIIYVSSVYEFPTNLSPDMNRSSRKPGRKKIGGLFRKRSQEFRPGDVVEKYWGKKTTPNHPNRVTTCVTASVNCLWAWLKKDWLVVWSLNMFTLW